MLARAFSLVVLGTGGDGSGLQPLRRGLRRWLWRRLRGRPRIARFLEDALK